MNNFEKAMQFRHATKQFDDSRTISEEDFNTILEAGRMSPSSFGFEPWKFVVIQNSELREKMLEFAWGAQGQLPTASHFMVILARKHKDMHFGSDYIHHMMHDVKQLPDDVIEIYHSFYKKFQQEDFKLLDTERSLNDWSAKQTYIALANMMTGAAYLGIDSCPIEGFDMDMTTEFIQKELGINIDHYAPAVMAAFGYRKEEPRPKSRQALDEVVTWYR